MPCPTARCGTGCSRPARPRAAPRHARGAVAQFLRRYHVDAAQAERVRFACLKIFDSIHPRTRKSTSRKRLLLEGRLAWRRSGSQWRTPASQAFRLHLSNADMPGFSRMEQQASRASCSRTAASSARCATKAWRAATGRWVFALRIAALVLRNRTDAASPAARGRRRRGTRSTCRRPGSRKTRSRPRRSKPRRPTGRRWTCASRSTVFQKRKSRSSAIREFRAEHRTHDDLRLAAPVAALKPPQPAFLDRPLGSRAADQKRRCIAEVS